MALSPSYGQRTLNPETFPEVARGEEQSFPAHVWALVGVRLKRRRCCDLQDWFHRRRFRSAYQKQRWAVVELLQYSFLDDDDEESHIQSRKCLISPPPSTCWIKVSGIFQADHENPFANSSNLWDSSPADRIKFISGEPEWIPVEEDQEWIEVRGDETGEIEKM